MFHTCSICLDETLIPVELTVFPCCSSQERNCYSFKRLCESCVKIYLELDVKLEQRSTFKKCLFCNSCINPRDIVNKPYKKDFLLMSMDTRVLKCKDCEFQGTHLELEKHLEKNCPQKIIECFCNISGTREKIESSSHRKVCCFFKQCLICLEYIYCNDFEKHLSLEHKMFHCQLCQKPTMTPLDLHIQEECSLRVVNCKHCPKKLIANVYLDHIVEHIHDSKLRLSLIDDLKVKEMDMFHRLSLEVQKMYELTYGDLITE